MSETTDEPGRQHEPGGAIRLRVTGDLRLPPLTTGLLSRLAANAFHAHMLNQFPGRTMGGLEMYDAARIGEWEEIARAVYVTLAVEAGAEATNLGER